MLDKGVAFIHDGKVHDFLGKKLHDACSEVNLLPLKFAARCGIPYSASSMQIATSLNGAGRVIGKVDGPIHTVLNLGTAVEGRTFTPAATKFLVIVVVDHMYDVLLSTHFTHDWGSRPDPVTGLLEYRPCLTRGDIHTMASVPDHLNKTLAKLPGCRCFHVWSHFVQQSGGWNGRHSSPHSEPALQVCFTCAGAWAKQQQV